MRLNATLGLVSVILLGASPALAQGTMPPGQPPPGQPPPGQPPPGQPPPGQYPPPPSVGGLTAPPPIDPSKTGEAGQADRDLDESEEDDSERGLSWFWIDAEGGFQHVGLETFEVDQSNLTAGFIPLEASGGFVGAGIGARLLFLTLGPRGRVGFYEDWQLFSLGGELGFRFQLGILEPHFELGGGYAALGSVGGTLSGVSDSIDISGGYGRISGGLDFFLGNVVSIGAAASWEFMGLTRPGVSLTDINAAQETKDLEEAEKQALAAEGSGYGSAISIGGKLGLHF